MTMLLRTSQWCVSPLNHVRHNTSLNLCTKYLGRNLHCSRLKDVHSPCQKHAVSLPKMGQWFFGGARNHHDKLFSSSQMRTIFSVSCRRGLLNNNGSIHRQNIWSRQFLKRLLSSKTNGSPKSQQAPKKTGNGTAPKSTDFKRLLLLAKPERYRLAVAVVCLLISSAAMMTMPFGIGRVIDIIYSQTEDGGGDMVRRLRQVCLLLLGVFVCGAVANFGRVYLMQSSGNRIIKKLRELLFGSMIRQEIAFFDKTKTGELINRLSTDTSLVGQSVTQNISDGLRAIAQAAGGITMMVYMSPKLALLALSIVPPMALMSRTYGRYVKNITRNVQDSLADATQVAEERLSNMRTVRAFAQEMREMSVYNQKIDHVLNLSYKEAVARGVFWASTALSGNVMILAIFYTGGLMMNESQITVGELSSFLLYAAFVGASVGGMSTFYTELMRGLGASTRLWELVDRSPAIPVTDGLIPSKELKGDIQFASVDFSYPTREDSAVLSGFDLQVDSGSVLAVVGPSGSGKSTIASLILRYYDPQQGRILVDGHDIKEISPHWLRTHIGVVSQEPILFSSTIADNIAYGALDPTQVAPAQVLEAARMANAINFVDTFHEGMDTLVGERGVMLSGGQKQRIAIARAILKNPKILLLDEATSALDAESEYLVQEALDRVMVGRTVITIAHRLSTIRNADRIAVLDAGRVAEMGTYDDLIAMPNGMFRKLVDRQTISNG